MIRGSVGIGRRARLRILCSLRTCGFKSHLPHYITNIRGDYAGVAELADAQASGACGSNIVWVQVPSSALFFYSKKETDTVSFFSVLMIQKTSDNGKSSMWFHYRNEFRLLSYIPAFSDKNKDLHISHRQLLFSFWH